ncbi:MAG: DUF3105 domain-containing protein [Elainellaceae cyanobacterium]
MTQETTSKRRTSRRRASDGPNVMSILVGPVGVAALMVVLIGGLWYRDRASQVPFEPNTEIGQAALETVETAPDLGREHVDRGQPVNYEEDFPTSGPHDPNPVMPGVYVQEQRPEQIVHALEHGNIVIYRDQPDAETLQTIEAWADQFTGPWDGVVVVPSPGLGEAVVLTAWTKKLVLPEFKPEAAASFIDEYRGRGPENPVR